MFIKDLTITIVTPQGRRDKLIRQLDYLSCLENKIIIADSSIEKLDFDSLINVPEDIDYYHVSDLNYHEKLNLVLVNVTTPFVINLTDDDFTNLNAIQQGIEFLKKNKNYSCVAGYFLDFNEKNLSICKGVSIYQNKKIKRMIIENFYSKSIFLRLIYWSSAYRSITTQHHLCRTKVKKRSMSYLKENIFNALMYTDRIPLASDSIEGNIKYLPLLWQIRSNGQKTNRKGSENFLKKLNFFRNNTSHIPFDKLNDKVSRESFVKSLKNKNKLSSRIRDLQKNEVFKPEEIIAFAFEEEFKLKKYFPLKNRNFLTKKSFIKFCFYLWDFFKGLFFKRYFLNRYLKNLLEEENYNDALFFIKKALKK